jgi:hypothetical protein
MLIEIITDENGDAIGWDISPETSEDNETLATMRDLQFFGIDDTAIKYDGIELEDEQAGKVLGNLSKLRFRQKCHKRK